MGLVALTGCCDTPKRKNDFCARHAREDVQPPPAERVRRVRWKAAVAQIVGDLVEVWIGDSAVNEKKVAIDSVAPGALDAHLRELSVARLRSRPFQDEAAQGNGQTPLMDVPDETTLSELASLKCTTRKMGLASRSTGRA
jgi:uncharacterized protein YchJ